ncbi:MAG: phenylacetate--CoA ligase family protein [Oligoflexia bacterium]|nr:phenylacetate--CoA ligase family protein [Oligoflexia bacterium]
MIYSVNELLAHAIEFSPYYRQLYYKCDGEWNSIPIVRHEHFWKANTIENNQLLTLPFEQTDGVVFKSGGTTGCPKFSLYSIEEWEEFTQQFAWGMGHLFWGDGNAKRVANLFYAGGLYASFVFIMRSLEKCSSPASAARRLLHFPLSGQAPISDNLKAIADYQIDTLVGIPTTIVSLADEIHRRRCLGPRAGVGANAGANTDPGKMIKRIFFGGESLYPDQKKFLEDIFPGVHISSIGYASVDAGHLGYFSSECSEGEHQVFADSSIMEIVDEETLEPITIPLKVGKLVYTNLTRKVMPIIRYPVGDRAYWTIFDGQRSPQNRFKLQGRSDEGARVGTVTISIDDLAPILHQVPSHMHIIQKQLLSERVAGKDRLTIKLALANFADLASIGDGNTESLLSALYEQRPQLQGEVDNGKVLPPQILFTDINSLESNPRTGKIPQVIDRR